MIMYVHRIIYKMSMLVCVYYAPMFMLMDMDVTIIQFFIAKRILYHKQCTDYHNSKSNVKLKCRSFA